MRNMISTELEKIKNEVHMALQDLITSFSMSDKHVLVIGTSTSEVLGKQIGSAGSEDIAKIIFDTINEFKDSYHFHLAFQGCEHINRALVVERATAERFSFDIVSVVPIRKAGGAMATYAYNHMNDPVVVEFIKADCGIDIGNTLIGMHLKHVAVPVRARVNKVGQANITMAKTRPKLIGGIRAHYTKDDIDTVTFVRETDITAKTDGETC